MSWGELDLRLYVCVVDGRTWTWTSSVATSAKVGTEEGEGLGLVLLALLKKQIPNYRARVTNHLRNQIQSQPAETNSYQYLSNLLTKLSSK